MIPLHATVPTLIVIRDAGIDRLRNEPSHLAACLLPRGPVVALRLQPGIIREHAQAPQHAGKKRELLLVINFDASHAGPTPIRLRTQLPSRVVATETIIWSRSDNLSARREDE